MPGAGCGLVTTQNSVWKKTVLRVVALWKAISEQCLCSSDYVVAPLMQYVAARCELALAGGL